MIIFYPLEHIHKQSISRLLSDHFYEDILISYFT